MNKKISIIYLGLAIGFLNAFDGVATNYGVLNNFIEEANPLMETLLLASPIIFLSVKSALSALVIFVCYLVYKHSKEIFQRFFSIALVGVSFMYVGILGLHLYWISLL
ncbi:MULTISPECIES: DUF5658 family protein [Lysinibacillus]|uniref:DUF5658 domain-containing protein n=1 Tax=Lysinibacillus antri TaxID=2498145 RepID=A0A432LDU0_9BACI|nr:MULTISPECIES: DUF5658 family protein [Lysinibacillus]RUL54678.1 hypothetical protein EK386_05805 [Lysinibacillus antri]TSI11037.1 hypothetical protein FJQ64_02355 [Lysinibacillus sp. BW-2-10]